MIFRRLLLYLYGAPVDRSVGVDQLCELMLLADRYSVDNLKAICEQTLVSSIDGDSVICLYGISDRFNATALKARCLSYLSQHTELTQLDIFQELPVYLQVGCTPHSCKVGKKKTKMLTHCLCVLCHPERGAGADTVVRAGPGTVVRSGAIPHRSGLPPQPEEPVEGGEIVTVAQNVTLLHVTVMTPAPTPLLVERCDC